MSRHLAMAASGGVCVAFIALAGCAASTSNSPATPTPTSTTEASPTGTSPAVTSPKPTSSTVPITSAPTPTASTGAGYLTVTISELPSHPALTFGGAPLQFTVTLRNTADHAYRDVTPLVSIGHSTANISPARVAPNGTLAELDSATGNWRPVFYDREGTGMDYIMAPIVQQPAFALSPGETASFTFRVAFSASASQGTMWLPVGQTAIDVTVIQLPARTWIGNRPAAAVPVTTITR